MPNKDRNKRSVRKARAEERARLEAASADSPKESEDKAKDKAKVKDKAVTKAKSKDKAVAKAKSDKKPGFFKRIANWFGDVRLEMHRVTWPTKAELTNYSVAVIITLVVFGVILWLVDSGIVAALVGFTGLRG